MAFDAVVSKSRRMRCCCLRCVREVLSTVFVTVLLLLRVCVFCVSCRKRHSSMSRMCSVMHLNAISSAHHSDWLFGGDDYDCASPKSVSISIKFKVI